MRKLILALCLCFASSTAFAKATLRIPLVIEGKKAGVPAAEINKKLQKVGAAPIPTEIEISTGEDAYQKFKELDAGIEKSLQALGPDYEYVTRQSELTPGDNDRPGLETCYLGNAREVADVVGGLTDLAYSDQLNIWGWKYKSVTKLETESGEDLNDFLAKRSKLWKEWSGNGDAVLVLTAYGDDGDDVNESVIKRCR